MTIKLVIFDFDDTLFSKTEVNKEIISRLLSETSEKSKEEIKKEYNKVCLEINIKQFENSCDFYDEFNKRFFEKIDIESNEVNLNKFNEILKEARKEAKDTVIIYPFVKEILQELKNKEYKLALLTGSSDYKKNPNKKDTTYKKERLDNLLISGGVKDYFDIFIGGLDVELKPHKNSFLDIVKKYNLRPDEVVMIGDSESDMLAKNYGLKTILFNPQDEYGGDIQPDAILRDYRELTKLLASF